MKNAPLNKAITFLRKYKILHILFWIWSTIDLFHLQATTGPKATTPVFDAIHVKVFQILCVYFVVYYLMPVFLKKKKYVKFITLTIITIIAAAVLTLVVKDVEVLIVKGRHLHSYVILATLVSHVTELVLVTAIFFAIYTVQGLYETEQRNQKLEKERLETELNFLKAQINPHFLFNAINSIYVLINEDKKLASDTLLNFSGLLRYQLYDCAGDHMPLARELEFLKDYIDLEVQRHAADLEVSFHAEPEAGHFEIAPFVLIPFVENAFKHRSHRNEGNFIRISATVSKGQFCFEACNSYDVDTFVADTGEGGIGLTNVRRRLELLYPGKYDLQLRKDNGVYCVNLQLDLNEDAMHTGR